MQPFVMIGASGRSRTGTPVKARDFKSLVSTNFTTEANFKKPPVNSWYSFTILSQVSDATLRKLNWAYS